MLLFLVQFAIVCIVFDVACGCLSLLVGCCVCGC